MDIITRITLAAADFSSKHGDTPRRIYLGKTECEELRAAFTGTCRDLPESVKFSDGSWGFYRGASLFEIATTQEHLVVA